ncbi:hypothetical protein C0J52_01177 [Blattella germanica]|nr:hypothetical protein C0J52_01177 [Blattella germanica]
MGFKISLRDPVTRSGVRANISTHWVIARFTMQGTHGWNSRSITNKWTQHCSIIDQKQPQPQRI